MAYVGEQSLELPAAALPCASCHGLDGQGKPEGGINPSNITWEFLTKSYEQTGPYARKHPPYTNHGIELAITRGLDPAGNKLLSVMPRYVMSSEDLADLIAYMALVGRDRDPGITENTIVIGTVLPAKGALAEMGQAVKAVTTAFFDELNKAGGLYNRRVDLKFAETGETPAATLESIDKLLADQPVFAMTGAFVAGAEKEVLPIFARNEVPLVGPFTLYPQTASPLNRQVFYLLSGIGDQERTLTDFAAKKPEVRKSGIAIVYVQDENNSSVVEAIRQQNKKAALIEPQEISYVATHFDAVETARQLKQAKREAVFLLGRSEDSLLFMKEAEKLGWFPFIFSPSASVGREVFDAPVGFDGRIFVAFPTSPADQSAESMKEFRALAEAYHLPNRHLAAQISAFSAAKVLVEGMKRAGKDLSREKLIQALEGFYEYPTGLTPPITFGPNRRIGALGSYVVTINLKEKQFSPASGWIGID